MKSGMAAHLSLKSLFWYTKLNGSFSDTYTLFSVVTYDLVDYDGELDPHREPRYAQPHHATAAPEAKLIAIRNTMPIRSALHSSTNYF